MRNLYVRPAPTLRYRIGHAAVEARVMVPDYCRALLNRWRNAGSLDLGEAENEQGPYQQIRIPVGEPVHAHVRTTAAKWDVSQSVVLVRIFHAYAPFVEEVLVREISGEPPPNINA